ncbi:MAG: YggS family pyridoxal phosphate-dependent enzyme [Dehalococcoidia bacterium]
MGVAENLASVRERMEAACLRAVRSPDDVTLVGVSKGFPPAVVAEACAAGLSDLGENRIQEAAPKIEALAAMGVRPRWHLVGHLQSNKAKTAAGLFAIIHSVDSVRLAEALSRRATEPLPVLLEVNVAGEPAKFGFATAAVPDALSSIASLPNLDVRGLMTVAPQASDPEAVRPVFRQLRELRDDLGLQELSMGMTDDFEVAIDEGATLVRVGRAIFGERAEA